MYQYNDCIFRLLIKRYFIQVSTFLISEEWLYKNGSGQQLSSARSGYNAQNAPKKAANSYSL